MTNTTDVVIYAASDDLIEVEGAICEEFNDTAFCDGAYVYASTGDILRFRLEDEGWRATVVHNATSPDADRLDGEDDRVTLTGPIAWVVATTTAPAGDL